MSWCSPTQESRAAVVTPVVAHCLTGCPVASCLCECPSTFPNKYVKWERRFQFQFSPPPPSLCFGRSSSPSTKSRISLSVSVPSWSYCSAQRCGNWLYRSKVPLHCWRTEWQHWMVPSSLLLRVFCMFVLQHKAFILSGKYRYTAHCSVRCVNKICEQQAGAQSGGPVSPATSLPQHKTSPQKIRNGPAQRKLRSFPYNNGKCALFEICLSLWHTHTHTHEFGLCSLLTQRQGRIYCQAN